MLACSLLTPLTSFIARGRRVQCYARCCCKCVLRQYAVEERCPRSIAVDRQLRLAGRRQHAARSDPGADATAGSILFAAASEPCDGSVVARHHIVEPGILEPRG